MLTKLHHAFQAFLSVFRGHNTADTPVDVIKAQLHEPRPLPIGISEFEEWSNRILSGCCFSAERESQVWALAIMLLQLGPHEDFVADAHFIKGLRAAAVKQTADSVAQEIKQAKAKKQKEAKEAAEGLAKEVAANISKLEPIKCDGVLAK